MNKYFLFIIIAIGFISCNPSTHFEKKTNFESSDWNKFNDLTYHIPVEAGKSYTFEGVIITDSTYTHRKMELGFYLYLPGGEERLSNHSIRIRDYEYEPLGEKTQIGYRMSVMLKKNLNIEEDGDLKITISLHSQYLNNFGIKSFNLLVFED